MHVAVRGKKEMCTGDHEHDSVEVVVTINPFATDNTPMCGGKSESSKYTTIQLVLKTYFVKIF